MRTQARQSARPARDPRTSTRGGTSLLGRLDLPVVATILVLLFLVNGVVLAWRYAEARSRPATSYYETQIERWQQQLVANPEDPVVWGTIGGLYEEMGEKSKADSAFAKALEYDPNNVTAMLHKSRRARADGDYDTARTLLSNIIEEVPETGRYLVYYELGEVERAAGETSAAIAAFERSVSDNGSYFNGYQQLAFLYDKTGDINKALAAAEKANAFAGGSQQDLVALIESLRSRGATSTGAGE